MPATLGLFALTFSPTIILRVFKLIRGLSEVLDPQHLYKAPGKTLFRGFFNGSLTGP